MAIARIMFSSEEMYGMTPQPRATTSCWFKACKPANSKTRH